jgi:hypothetical protein
MGAKQRQFSHLDNRTHSAHVSIGARVRVLSFLPLFAVASCAPLLDYTGLSGRQVIDYQRRDGLAVRCVGPPPEVFVKEMNSGAHSNAAARQLVALARGNEADAANLEQLGKLSSLDSDLEVVRFRLCELYGNGAITPDEYHRLENLLSLAK